MLDFDARIYHQVAEQKNLLAMPNGQNATGIIGVNAFEFDMNDISQADLNRATNARYVITTCEWTCVESAYSIKCSTPKCTDSDVKDDGNGIVPANQKPYTPPSLGGIPTRAHKSKGAASSVSSIPSGNNPIKPSRLNWSTLMPYQIVSLKCTPNVGQQIGYLKV